MEQDEVDNLVVPILIGTCQIDYNRSHGEIRIRRLWSWRRSRILVGTVPNKIVPGNPRIGNLFSFLYKSICFIQ